MRIKVIRRGLNPEIQIFNKNKYEMGVFTIHNSKPICIGRYSTPYGEELDDLHYETYITGIKVISGIYAQEKKKAEKDSRQLKLNLIGGKTNEE